MTKLPNLPIGIQTFSEIINRKDLYIDKTRQIHRLITSGKYYFLSRPRRFGKSLTLSTIESIYTGQRDLFAGLWIAEEWDWEKVHPVLHISFSSVDYQGVGLEEAVKQMLMLQAEEHGVELKNQSMQPMFAELIRVLSDRGKNQVVILIDEYDKPIIDYLQEKEIARENRQILRRFYSIIKDSDPYIELFLITGVSKFAKVSIFSELNNLDDITIDRRFSDLTGYTQDELEEYFALHMNEVEAALGIERPELLEKLRYWYNGYTWDGDIYVYNPFSILNFFQKFTFRNFWFETGTPTFLLQLMREQHVLKLDNLRTTDRALSTYDIDNLQAIPILFQTGYLTIQHIGEFGSYYLGYPNAEVKESLLDYMIADMRSEQAVLTKPLVIDLYEALHDYDLARLIEIIKNIFKNIPSQIFLHKAEAYYHSLIYMVFLYLGQYVESEVNTNTGRLDCVVQTPNHIFILEFKLDQSAEAALEQIKARGYAEKYAIDPRPKVLLGINFSSSDKNVEGWLHEEHSR